MAANRRKSNDRLWAKSEKRDEKYFEVYRLKIRDKRTAPERKAADADVR